MRYKARYMRLARVIPVRRQSDVATLEALWSLGRRQSTLPKDRLSIERVTRPSNELDEPNFEAVVEANIKVSPVALRWTTGLTLVELQTVYVRALLVNGAPAGVKVRRAGITRSSSTSGAHRGRHRTKLRRLGRASYRRTCYFLRDRTSYQRR